MHDTEGQVNRIQAEGAVYCGECGSAVSGSKFCTHCGTAIKTGPLAVPERTVHKPTVSPPHRRTAEVRTHKPKSAEEPTKSLELPFDQKKLALGAGIAAALLLVSVLGTYAFQAYQAHVIEQKRQALSAQTLSAKGRIESAWSVAVGAHAAYLSQMRHTPRQDETPLVESARKIKAELKGQLDGLRSTVPTYSENPTLMALANGLQMEAEAYDRIPELLKLKAWDPAAADLVTQKLKSAETELKSVTTGISGLSPGIGIDFSDLKPVQEQVDYRRRVRAEQLKYAQDFSSLLNRYNNTRDEMQRFADRIRTGTVTRGEALVEFRAAQSSRMALRNELTRLNPPARFKGLQAELDGCIQASLVALDNAIQAIMAEAQDSYFDAVMYWQQFSRDSNGISDRLSSLESQFNQARASIH